MHLHSKQHYRLVSYIMMGLEKYYAYFELCNYGSFNSMEHGLLTELDEGGERKIFPKIDLTCVNPL